MAVNEYLIYWSAWPDGARVLSSGTETEYGKTENEAVARFCQRYPICDVERIDLIQSFDTTKGG